MNKKQILTALLDILYAKLKETQGYLKDNKDVSGDTIEELLVNETNELIADRTNMLSLNGKILNSLTRAINTVESTLEKITDKKNEKIVTGALVTIKNGSEHSEEIFMMLENVYETKIVFNGVKVLLVSPNSPVGRKLAGKTKGETVLLNTRKITVVSVA